MSVPMERIININSAKLEQSGFFWREKDGVKVLVCKELEDAGFVNGFSTRLGGVSPYPENDLNLAGFGEDTDENIAENRRRFLNAFPDGFSITTVWQVHGDEVKIIRTDKDILSTYGKFDAMISDRKKVFVGVKTADCVPILIGDPKTGAFSAVHAGWRGTAESIVKKAIKRMNSEYGTKPQDLICALGPAACGRNYEVGPEVVEVFEKKFSSCGKLFEETQNGHALVDLNLANRDQLEELGAQKPKIFTAPFCTMENSDLFFSYRVDRKKIGKTGRLMSVVGRNT